MKSWRSRAQHLVPASSRRCEIDRISSPLRGMPRIFWTWNSATHVPPGEVLLEITHGHLVKSHVFLMVLIILVRHGQVGEYPVERQNPRCQRD